MAEKIIAQAAEAIIIQQGDKVIKRRISKGYRIPKIDNKLRKARTRIEAKLLRKAPINAPKVLGENEEKAEITMNFISGKKLSETLDTLKNKLKIAELIGQETAKLHDANIIHGDLTTSNMILVEKKDNENKAQKIKEEVEEAKEESRTKREDNKTLTNKQTNSKIYFIDFGLGFTSSKIEDKAVDIHLLKQALEAKHFLHHQALFQSFLKGYNPEDKPKILAQLKKVEARGRYKEK